MLDLANGCRTLGTVHNFMKAQVNEKWTKRLFRKASIEAALTDFDKKLGDAAQMFQVRPDGPSEYPFDEKKTFKMAMLIDISHHVLSRKTDVSRPRSNEDEISAKQDVDLEQLPAYQSRQILDKQSTTPPQYDQENVQDDKSNVTLMIEGSEDADDVLISDTVLEDHGVRFHSAAPTCLILP